MLPKVKSSRQLRRPLDWRAGIQRIYRVKSDNGGEITLSFTEQEGPFRWKVTEAHQGSLVRWECLAGPGQSAGTTATFRLSSAGSDKTIVDLDHKGFEDSLWGALMHQLKQFVETKQPKPAFA